MVEGRFKITKPSTSEDDGTPSDSCLEDVKRVFRLIEDERHLIAEGLYRDVLGRLREGNAESSSSPSNKHHKLRLRRSKSSKLKEEHVKDMQAAQDLIDSKKAVLDDLDVSFLVG
jgi:hypothetical protein